MLIRGYVGTLQAHIEGTGNAVTLQSPNGIVQSVNQINSTTAELVLSKSMTGFEVYGDTGGTITINGNGPDGIGPISIQTGYSNTCEPFGKIMITASSATATWELNLMGAGN